MTPSAKRVVPFRTSVVFQTWIEMERTLCRSKAQELLSPLLKHDPKAESPLSFLETKRSAGPAARTACLGKPSCRPRLLQRLVRPVRGESSITGLRRTPAVNHA